MLPWALHSVPPGHVSWFVCFNLTQLSLPFNNNVSPRNYGEYSGAPNTSETYQYARTVLDCATSHADGRERALLIGGGIANFTDVAATFTGIIQALKEKKAALQVGVT